MEDMTYPEISVKMCKYNLFGGNGQMGVSSAECGFDIRRFAARHTRRFTATVAGMAAIVVLSFTAAGAAVPASCDPTYWDALKGKAWMEAQREIEQNQNLIYKADSVLEYTCFDKFLNVLASSAPSLFSSTTQWGTITPATDMTTALQILVGGAAQAWVTSNFNHDFLGGRRNTPSYTLNNVAAGAYSCDVMDQVWKVAKCMNFVDKTHDDFFDLTKYDGWDARALPNACTADSRWAAQSAAAGNTGTGGVPTYRTETYNTYSAFFTTSPSCSAPKIPTGIKVNRPPIGPYDEYICVNAGCAYSWSSANCVTNP
jgi:hypothetical protein